MGKLKNKKDKKNIYILSFFFVLCLISLIHFNKTSFDKTNFKKINFKETNFIKSITSFNKIEKLNEDKNVDKIINENEQSEMNQEDKFIITFNKEDLIEQQKSISADDAGEIN